MFTETQAANSFPRGHMNGYANGYPYSPTYGSPFSLPDAPSPLGQAKFRTNDFINGQIKDLPQDNSYMNSYTSGFANGFSGGFSSGFTSGFASGQASSFTNGHASEDHHHHQQQQHNRHQHGNSHAYDYDSAYQDHPNSYAISSHINGCTKERFSSRVKTVDINEIAVLPNDPEAVPDLLDQIATLGRSISLDDRKARLQLRDIARSLSNALETPREAILRHCWSQATGHATIETAINLGIFSILALDNKPKSVSELAYATNSDPVLLSRVMKHLASIEVLTEIGTDEYRGTNLSTTLSLERYSDAFPLMSRWFYPGIFALPSFLEKTDYRNPNDMTKAAFQAGHNSDEHFFDVAKRDATLAAQFNNHMSVYSQGRPSWMDKDFYPVRERLFVGANPDKQSVFLVDMGGGTGHDLSEFQRKCSDAPGRLILQDLPEVVDAAKGLHPSIEPMAHDFFTEQPVKGARAYYLHSVLHDWPDDVCRTIFANVIPAMKRGYSKLLINENVVPGTGAHWETTSLDLIMMSMASVERSEKHWQQLVQAAGLKVVKIWTGGKGVESLIECELA